jgi:hypothetical protein
MGGVCGVGGLVAIISLTSVTLMMKRGVVWLKSSHLSLVRSYKDIGCDEERVGGVVKVI